MGKLKVGKRVLIAFASVVSILTVLSAGVYLGGARSDLEAAKKHVAEHPQRMAEYNIVVQEFRVFRGTMGSELKAAQSHRERQDAHMRLIVKHLERIGVFTEPVVLNGNGGGSDGIPN